MKRLSALLGLIVFLSLIGTGMLNSGACANSSVASTSVLDIVLTKQNPYPAEPGKNLDIEIEIQNLGNTDALKRAVEIMAEDPFMLLPGEQRVKGFDRIGAVGSVKTSYRLYVNDSAITGDYDLDFRIYEGELRSSYSTKSVSISIQGEPKLVLEDITISGNPEPSGFADLTVKIKNVGTGTARDLQLDFGSTAELIPVLSMGSVFIGDLGPGKTGEVVLRLNIDSSAEHRTYSTNITANYMDENSEETEKYFDVGIPVTGTISLEVVKRSVNFQRMKLDIEVANKGTTDAKSVEAKLVIDGNIIDVDYISQLKSTKKTTFSFPLVMKGSGELLINYTGPGLEKNQDSFDMVLDYTMPSGDGTGTYLLVFVVLVIIGFYFWRKRRKKK